MYMFHDEVTDIIHLKFPSLGLGDSTTECGNQLNICFFGRGLPSSELDLNSHQVQQAADLVLIPGSAYEYT